MLLALLAKWRLFGVIVAKALLSFGGPFSSPACRLNGCTSQCVAAGNFSGYSKENGSQWEHIRG